MSEFSEFLKRASEDVHSAEERVRRARLRDEAVDRMNAASLRSKERMKPFEDANGCLLWAIWPFWAITIMLPFCKIGEGMHSAFGAIIGFTGLVLSIVATGFTPVGFHYLIEYFRHSPKRRAALAEYEHFRTIARQNGFDERKTKQ